MVYEKQHLALPEVLMTVAEINVNMCQHGLADFF